LNISFLLPKKKKKSCGSGGGGGGGSSSSYNNHRGGTGSTGGVFFVITIIVIILVIIIIFSQAIRLLGLIRTVTFFFSSLRSLLTIYCNLVRPKLEYTIWQQMPSTVTPLYSVDIRPWFI
jgi:uncharacterized spore protein YtfJ